jgi:hypothetical protein
MKTFAQLSGNIVTNVLAGENIDDVKAVVGNDVVEYTAENPAGIGWTYDPEAGTFTPPAE